MINPFCVDTREDMFIWRLAIVFGIAFSVHVMSRVEVAVLRLNNKLAYGTNRCIVVGKNPSRLEK